MKRLILLVLIMVVCCSCVFGCTTVTGNEGNSTSESEKENTPTVSTVPEEVTDEKIISQLLAYDYDFEELAPGSDRSIRHLWDGTSPDIMYQGSFNESDGYDTFLTEYLPESDDYYFVYLKSSLIQSYVTYLQEYRQSATISSLNYLSIVKLDKQDFVNGKYLFAHYKLDGSYEDIKVYKCNDLEKMSFTIDEYQMVFCGKIKPVIIKSNVSKKEEINKKINIYRCQELSYIAQEEKFELYFSTYFKDVDSSYVGEKLILSKEEYGAVECLYAPKYEDLEGCYNLPSLEVKVIDGKKYVELTRYYRVTLKEAGWNAWVDLLDENVDFYYSSGLNFKNIYGCYKSEFKEAFVKISECGEYSIRALYDFDKVCEIIR